MSTNDDVAIALCRTLLRRAAWRLQYRIRTQRARECTPLSDYQERNDSFDMEIVSEVYVKELLDEIPWKKCRYIIQRIIIEGMTEKEVALELQITPAGGEQMEKERFRSPTPESQSFTQIVRKAQNGDKKSMEEILNFFKDDIEYLARFIKLPREEAIQALKIELINIVCENL